MLDMVFCSNQEHDDLSGGSRNCSLVMEKSLSGRF